MSADAQDSEECESLLNKERRHSADVIALFSGRV